MLEKHVIPTPPLPTHLVTQVWHKALTVFLVKESGAWRFSELQLHVWTHVSADEGNPMRLCDISTWMDTCGRGIYKKI